MFISSNLHRDTVKSKLPHYYGQPCLHVGYISRSRFIDAVAGRQAVRYRSATISYMLKYTGADDVQADNLRLSKVLPVT